LKASLYLDGFFKLGIFMEIEMMAKNHRLFQNDIERKRFNVNLGQNL
jgi:hypothetical protein